MVNTRALFIAMAIGTLLAGGRVARADDWTSFGLGSGRLSAERSGPRFAAGWRYELPAERQSIYRAVVASPAVADGFLALGNYGDRVFVLGEADGKPRWNTDVAGPHHASPAAWRGWLFVPSTDLGLRALRLADGSVAWQRELPGMGLGSPVVVDGGLFVATAEASPRLLRLVPETGEIVWQTGAEQLQQGARAAVVVADEHVLVAETGGRLHSFGRGDGAWQWTALAPGNVNHSAPVVVGDRVFLAPGGDSARLHAFVLATGAVAPGFPVDLPALAADAGAGTAMPSEQVLSSLAGTTDLLVLTLRTDERFDTNADATPDRFVSRERLLALDPATGAVKWTAAAGRLETTDGNLVPLHGLTSTPALFPAASGVMVAATSSLEPRLRVFAGATGEETWSAELAGPSRSSPVFANGRLVVATDAGTVHSFVSTSNQAPIVPVLGFLPAGGTEVDARAVTIKWGTAIDPEMGAVDYEVRVDGDGEILHSWQVSKQTAAGELALGALPTGVYTFAVRARDAQGAWSAWSAPTTFQAFVPPDVTVDGKPAGDLFAALATAQPGAVVMLGAGTFVLDRPLDVPAGVVVRGAGPHLTVLSGRGLEAAVKPGAGAHLEQLTVARAGVGVAVAAPDVRLTNVILRDNTGTGLEVAASGSATLVSATAARNGAAVRALGATSVRNTLCTGNGVGLSGGAALLSSHYNDVFGNTVADYEGRGADPTDLAAAVNFTDEKDHLRLLPAQPSTDRGDPADEFLKEPAPNGGRINIGAFGNTIYAELSALVPADDVDGGVGDGGTDGGMAQSTPAGCGCDVGGASPGAGVGLGLLFAVALLARRRR
jgi:MYXO-CTERM domain-containing protein